jgi:hypothetical protein
MRIKTMCFRVCNTVRSTHFRNKREREHDYKSNVDTHKVVVERTLADKLVEEDVADGHGGFREGLVADSGVVENDETLDGGAASGARQVVHVLSERKNIFYVFRFQKVSSSKLCFSSFSDFRWQA